MVLVHYSNWCMRAMWFSTGIQRQRLRKSVKNKKATRWIIRQRSKIYNIRLVELIYQKRKKQLECVCVRERERETSDH